MGYNTTVLVLNDALSTTIQANGDSAVISVKNASSNVALNVHSGYFLYAGPLKSVKDVSERLNALPLKLIVVALAGLDKVDVIDAPIVTTDIVESVVSVPVVKVDQVPIGPFAKISIPQFVTETQTSQVKVPSRSLVIGLVSYEDVANMRRTATFCFPVVSRVNDEECSKLNSLQLTNSSDNPPSP
jgi:hypothetical protein